MRLISYNWKFTQADYLDNIHASEEMATHYMEMVRDGHYDMAYGMVGYQGAAATDQTKWTRCCHLLLQLRGGIQEFSIRPEPEHGEHLWSGSRGARQLLYGGHQYGMRQQQHQKNLLFYQPDFRERHQAGESWKTGDLIRTSATATSVQPPGKAGKQSNETKAQCKGSTSFAQSVVQP